MLTIHIIPALKDNYIYLLRDEATGHTAVIDPSEAKPVLEVLKQKGWKLHYIWNTHHHWDHTGGNLALKQQTGCKIIGFVGDKHRLPGIDQIVADGEDLALGESVAKILFIPGHTLGHIAYWFEKDNALFCGDTLFSLGCGRLFEGTPEQMYTSLQKLAALPEETRVYCGHEYTVTNARFALSVDPDNQALQSHYTYALEKDQRHQPTLPSTIGIERTLNPFLRVKNAKEFAILRKDKDNFV